MVEAARSGDWPDEFGREVGQNADLCVSVDGHRRRPMLRVCWFPAGTRVHFVFGGCLQMMAACRESFLFPSSFRTPFQVRLGSSVKPIIPPSLLFDVQFSVPKCGPPSKSGKGLLLALADDSSLFLPSALDNSPGFATLRVGWSEDGFAVAVRVKGKPDAPWGSRSDLKRSDAVLLWLDTRPSGNVHRATEYCHHLVCLPYDERVDGPGVAAELIAQQRSLKVQTDPAKLLARIHRHPDGYEFELWIPADQLNGYREIPDLRRLGFHCVVADSHLGEQSIGVSDDFPNYDPSLWLTLELIG